MNRLFGHSTKVDLEIIDYEEMFGCKPDDSDFCDDDEVVAVDINPKTATIDVSSVVRAENAEKTTSKSRGERRSSRRAVY